MLPHGLGIAVHTVQHIGDDDAGVAPAGVAAVLGTEDVRDDVTVGAVEAFLRVARVTQPLLQKRADIRKIRGGTREDLRIAAPPEPLVALRAIGRDMQIIPAPPPLDVGAQAVALRVVRPHVSRLREIRRQRTAEDGQNFGFLRHLDLEITEAVKGEERLQHFPAPSGGDQTEERLGGTIIGEVQAPGRAVIPTIPPTGVVQHLGEADSHFRPRRRVHADARATDDILPEVEEQMLAGIERRVSGIVADALPSRHDVTEIGAVLLNPAPEHGADRAAREIREEPYGAAPPRRHLTGIIIALRRRPYISVAFRIRRRQAMVDRLPVVKIGEEDRTRDRRLPYLVGRDDPCFPVGIRQRQFRRNRRCAEPVNAERDTPGIVAGRHDKDKGILCREVRHKIIEIALGAHAIVRRPALELVIHRPLLRREPDALAVAVEVKEPERSGLEHRPLRLFPEAEAETERGEPCPLRRLVGIAVPFLPPWTAIRLSPIGRADDKRCFHGQSLLMIRVLRKQVRGLQDGTDSTR